MKLHFRTQATSRAARSKTIRARLYGIFRITVLLIIAVAIIWSWRLIRDPQFLPITQVKISGAFQHVDKKTIASISAPYVTGGFFTVNLTKLEQQLAQLPWVNSVVVQRVWPDAVAINVVEQIPVARWNDNALLNAQGEVFSPPVATFPDGLPTLQGPDDQELLILQQFQDWNHKLSPLGLNIVALQLDSRHAWQFTLNTGMQVSLGYDNVAGRLQRFINVYPRLLNDPNKQAQSVDLRYAEGLAIKWKDTSKAN